MSESLLAEHLFAGVEPKSNIQIEDKNYIWDSP
jgi:hypothetical protein